MADKIIIGITGKKFHGKDTLAQAILDAGGLPKECVHYFATPLKELCAKVFSQPLVKFTAPHLKEEPLGRIALHHFWDSVEEHTGVSRDAVEERLAAEGRTLPRFASTPREIMQIVGTDFVRTVKPDYWVHLLGLAVGESLRDVVVIPDVRLGNEAQWIIRQPRGVLVQVSRPHFPGKADTHVSEAGVSPEYLDFVLPFQEYSCPGELAHSMALAAQIVLRYARRIP